MLKLVNGTACYTGGGIYIFVGSTNDGNYFLNSDCGFQVFDNNPTEEGEDGEPVGFWYEWQEEHDITEKYNIDDIRNAWSIFYNDFINQKEGLDEGFESWSNYLVSDITSQDWEEIEF